MTIPAKLRLLLGSQPDITSNGRWLRVARWVPACLAAFELRHLLDRLTAASPASSAPSEGRLTPWLLALVALGAASVLRESGRGLVAQLPHPRWSRSLAQSWFGCSVAILGVLCCWRLVSSGTSGGLSINSIGIGPGSGLWSLALAALGAGFLLAASLTVARWALDAVARHRDPKLAPRAASTRRPQADTYARAPTPLLGGWSDRGPPRRVAVTAG